MTEDNLNARAQQALRAWRTTLSDDGRKSLEALDNQQRRDDKRWRRKGITNLDAEDWDDLTEKRPGNLPAGAVASSPVPGIEARDTLRYLAKHLTAQEFHAVRLAAEGKPTDKATLKSARHKAKHAILVMK